MCLSMPQNYKVFFYDNILYIGNRINLDQRFSIIHPFESAEKLRLLLFRFLKGKRGEVVLIEHPNTQLVWDAFCGLFLVKHAAGGLVYNQHNQWLFIKRKGLYDLPKGHVEPGELFEVTALREVSEECHLKKLKSEGFLTTTYHVYHTKSKIILKPSHWYLMKHTGTEKPMPQTEESITEAFFASITEMKAMLSHSFPSVAEVIASKITL